jgi:hypothetical protein
VLEAVSALMRVAAAASSPGSASAGWRSAIVDPGPADAPGPRMPGAGRPWPPRVSDARRRSLSGVSDRREDALSTERRRVPRDGDALLASNSMAVVIPSRHPIV